MYAHATPSCPAYRPSSLIDKWCRFRRGIAVRAAKEKRGHHPFRTPHEIRPTEIDGRTVEVRCVAVESGTVWTDEYFYLLVTIRWNKIKEKWNTRCERIEYEAQLMREYRASGQFAREELNS